jgi:hypothetical protein
MRRRHLSCILSTLAVWAGLAAPAQTHIAQVTRALAEQAGVHTGFGSAAAGLLTATGNLVHGRTELCFSVGLLRSDHISNSLDDTEPRISGRTTSLTAGLVPQSNGAVQLTDTGSRLTYGSSTT